MKLDNVINAVPALQKLASESLTPKTLYWVSKLLSKLEKDVDFFNAERNKLVQEFGAEIEPGKWKVREEQFSDFECRMGDLLNVEIDADFKVVQLPTSENIKLSYNDLRLLDGFVELALVDDDNR